MSSFNFEDLICHQSPHKKKIVFYRDYRYNQMKKDRANFIPDAHFKNFPFLRERFGHGVFTTLLNRYLLLILMQAERASCDVEDAVMSFVTMAFSPGLDALDSYSLDFLTYAVYGRLFTQQQKELLHLDDQDRFVLAFMHYYLSKRRRSSDEISEALYSLSGLLILNIRQNIKAEHRPKIVTREGRTLRYYQQFKFKKSILRYRNELEQACAQLERGKPFERSYLGIKNEFLSFVDVFVINYRQYLSLGLLIKLRHEYAGFLYQQSASGNNSK